MRLNSKVIFLGWVDRKKYFDLLNGARAFVFISSYEGFGLSPLEAMSVGTPVIASQDGSLKEVLGGASLTVKNARNVAEVAGKIMEVVDRTNKKLYEDLIKLGLVRSKHFDWDKCYTETEKFIYGLV
jgi:glycosyltransferase involved in cell wall biosynthesis